MVDDTYYITPHEAALAVVATSMKKSRLPFYILCINSIMGAFLFSAGGMLYVMCEAGGQGLIPGANIFVYICQGAVYAIGLFYVIVCGMELFNSNILFFSVGVMRGAVTLMDLFISWFVSFWVNLASTIFVVYVFCYCSGILKQENYIVGTCSINRSKDSFTFAETLLKGIAGNFFVCLAVYLQIMVKPLHVKFLMIFLPIFTFVSMGFTHVVADMFLVPAGIFNNCGYGWGRYFWKIMLPGAIGNMIGGSFFGIAIPWFLHLFVIENDMKKLNLPAYEERDEQPMLNMDSRVVRVPTHISPSNSEASSIREFKPDDENDISRVNTTRSTRSTAFEPDLGRVQTSAASIRSRTSRGPRQIRSPKGVFPVVDMGEPLMKEKTVASAYLPRSSIESPPNELDSIIDGTWHGNGGRADYDDLSQASSNSNNDDYLDEDNPVSIYSGDNDAQHGRKSELKPKQADIDDDSEDDEFAANPYDPEEEKMSSKLVRALTRTVTREPGKDLEKGHTGTADSSNDNEGDANGLARAITRTATRIGHELKSDLEKSIPTPPPKAKVKSSDNISHVIPQPSSGNIQNKRSNNKLFRQFTFGGGGNNNREIHRRLSNAKITRKAAAMSNDIAGIHESTVDSETHVKPRSYSDGKDSINNSGRRHSEASSSSKKYAAPVMQDARLGGPYSSDKWKHFTYDYELDGERPVSFISERSDEDEEAGAKKDITKGKD